MTTPTFNINDWITNQTNYVLDIPWRNYSIFTRGGVEYSRALPGLITDIYLVTFSYNISYADYFVAFNAIATLPTNIIARTNSSLTPEAKILKGTDRIHIITNNDGHMSFSLYNIS